MKVKCENIVTCGNYNCFWNDHSACCHSIVSLGPDGKCSLIKPKTEKPKTDKIEPNKF